ncbi:MAG TPA: IS4 family transposase [Saprospiraceae bacterium]|nr:IS4 family transposase [Saprospiraceae bacterium]
MSSVKLTLFSQILGLIDRSIFYKAVKKYKTDKFHKGINTWTHLVSMLFMQFANATSLRDISNGLRSATGNLNHLGVLKAPSKSSLSYINLHRDYRVFMDLYFALLDKLEPSLHNRRKYARRLKRKIFIMDASIILLCLSLFDWAKFRTKKGAIKLHAVLDYDTGLPSYAVISEGKTHDVTAAKQIIFPAQSVLVVDRAYVDFEWLYNLDSSKVFFVTRLKSNANIEQVKSFMTNDKHDHILSDEEIRLVGFYSSKKYPKKLRIVKVYDEQNDQTLVLLTNNMFWTADTVSQLYKARWDVEVFFKHLKQLFRVKTFVGTSSNAVRIQMWSSMIAMLLFRYLKNKAKYPWHLSNLITFLRINLFVKISLWKWVDKPVLEKVNSPPQPTLF